MQHNPGENIVMVTVATFPEALEAHIYRSRLESEGIPCVLGDENIISNQPWHSIAYGGIKLRVREQDAPHAQVIINELRYSQGPFLPQPEACPACGSEEIKTKISVSVLRQILSFLFLGGLPVGSRRALCLQCGHQWIISGANV